MKVLLYEWCCSGGLSGPDAAWMLPEAGAAIELEGTIREGRTMLEAVVADATRDDTLQVTVLVDAARVLALPTGVTVRTVSPGSEIDVLGEESRRADATLIIAPETRGILERRVAVARRGGGRVIAPGGRFIAVAADKQATIDALAAAGVPVPAGRSLAPGECWPPGFRLPAVRKARASVGCDQLLIVQAAEGTPPPAPQATRLEAFVPGTPVGVSCLCGPHGIHVLPPMLQLFSPGPQPEYRGGLLLRETRLVARAERLARRSIAAVISAVIGGGRSAAVSPPPESTAVGWVGVDMLLGADDDGRGDRVLEVNPRLTTSFVGLAAVFGQGLTRTLLAVADGHAVDIVSAAVADRQVEFDTTGRVRVTDGSA